MHGETCERERRALAREPLVRIPAHWEHAEAGEVECTARAEPRQEPEARPQGRKGREQRVHEIGADVLPLAVLRAPGVAVARGVGVERRRGLVERGRDHHRAIVGARMAEDERRPAPAQAVRLEGEPSEHR